MNRNYILHSGNESLHGTKVAIDAATEAEIEFKRDYIEETTGGILEPVGLTPEQAIANFKLLLELSDRNSYEQYRAAVREIAEICINLGIK